jgi:hypothetical protein
MFKRYLGSFFNVLFKDLPIYFVASLFLGFQGQLAMFDLFSLRVFEKLLGFFFRGASSFFYFNSKLVFPFLIEG